MNPTIFDESDLEQIRRKLRWSRDKMAKEIGIGRKTYWNWEYGRVVPTLQGRTLLNLFLARPQILKIKREIQAERLSSKDALLKKLGA